MPTLRICVERLEETRRPVDVITIRTDSNKTQRPLAIVRRPRGIAAEFSRVLLGSQIAAATPALIADAPQIDIKRRSVTICRTLRCERIGLSLRGGVRRHIACRRIAVFDLLVEVSRRKRSKIGGKVGLASNCTAGVHKLMQSIAVWVLLIPEPGTRGTL